MHEPEVQVALAWQLLVQKPQFVALVSRFVSQPSPHPPLQLPQFGLHAHEPLEQ